MIEQNGTYVVMGVLDANSIAFVTGKVLERFGARVVYCIQNERIKRIFFDHDSDLTDEERAELDIRFCDVTSDDEVHALFSGIGEIKGVLHSIAYVNPKTCLGEEFHTDAYEDLSKGFQISAVSLATVARHAVPNMPGGGSVVAMTFDTRHAFPHYNWMGVNKAALEACVRALARRHGRDLVRVNAVSAGPLHTKAASSIPGFGYLSRAWKSRSPLPWDTRRDKREVARAAAFLLGPFARKITGQVLYVDGGASIIAGEMLAHEQL